MVTILSPADVAGLSQPSIDNRGRLFVVDGHFYRAFSGNDARFYSDLLAASYLDDLFSAGLVRFWKADIAIDGFDLVVECERVPVVSYPPEWPISMLKEAGLTIARLGSALAKHGLGLQDAHPWNVLFKGTTAVFVDIGSILPCTKVSGWWHREFRQHLVLPLALSRVGLHRVSRAVASSHRATGAKGLGDNLLLRWLFPPTYARLAQSLGDPIRYYEALIGYLEGMSYRPARTKWSDYTQGHEARINEPATYHPKQQAIDTFLGKLPTGTLLDIGANAGWYSQLAAHHGHTVTAVDTDEWTIDALFTVAKQRNLPILPLIADIMWPSGSYGMALAYADAYTRLKADTTLAVAILHHLCGFQGVTFDLFAYVINQLTNHAAIVEFVPREDSHVSRWKLAQEPWYNLESLIKAMSPFFARVDVLPSSPEPRVMLLFQRL